MSQKVKITCPVVYCGITGKLAVPMGTVGTIEGIVQELNLISISFEDDHQVLINQGLGKKSWCFSSSEFKLVN